MTERTCPICQAQHQRRGIYCGGRCKKRAENAKRNGSDPRAAMRPLPAPYDCAQCGARCTPGENVVAHASRFCGQACKRYWHHIHSDGRSTRLDRAEAKLRRAAAGRGPSKPWFYRSCPECGAMFLTRHTPRDDNGYCSTQCQLRQKRRRRRAMRSGAGYKTLSYYSVAERDRWTCQLCGAPVDRTLGHPHPYSASLDHIVPLSFGGQHSEDNAQLAHFLCNSRKGNGSSAVRAGGQLTLV